MGEDSQAPSMEKRARFESRWLPYALIAPQMAITLVFFFLPASQAIYQSLQVQDAFGTPGSHPTENVELVILDALGWLNSVGRIDA